jgi:hypothetical protein
VKDAFYWSTLTLSALWTPLMLTLESTFSKCLFTVSSSRSSQWREIVQLSYGTLTAWKRSKPLKIWVLRMPLNSHPLLSTSQLDYCTRDASSLTFGKQRLTRRLRSMLYRCKLCQRQFWRKEICSSCWRCRAVDKWCRQLQTRKVEMFWLAKRVNKWAFWLMKPKQWTSLLQ